MKYLIVSAALCALAGCDLPPPPKAVTSVRPTAYHDVSYYDANPLARAQTKAWCNENPGLQSKVPSCDSAYVSALRAYHHQMGWD